MKTTMIGIGAFVSGVITGAVAMLVYKNIQIGKKSKLHEENYNNLNDLFGQQDSSNKTNIFNDTFSSSFSKSDLVDVFGVNFDSGDEYDEEDTEDWPNCEDKEDECNDEEYDEFVIEDEPEDDISDELEEYFESEIKDVFEV